MAADNPRTYGALRTVLIGYGTIVAAYLIPRGDEAAVPALGGFGQERIPLFPGPCPAPRARVNASSAMY